MKIRITSLGCRLNQSEISSVSTRLLEMGHDITTGNDADILIINSCSVTGRSERKTRQLMFRALKSTDDKNPGRIIITGCAPDDIQSNKNIFFVSNDRKYLIPEIISNMITRDSLHEKEPSRFNYTTPLRSSRNRVNLKIQDGCDNSCSYCIIPHHRGESQSKPLPDIVKEFKELVDAGYKEIILTGVMIGNYNWEGSGLDSLTEKLLNIKGKFRLHLTSLSPNSVTPHLIDLLSEEKMVKHLHLSLQSGSNSILRKMNRLYTREEYLKLADEIKKRVTGFNFTTDVIVGFPSETDKDFKDTMDLIKGIGFSHIHAFRYSPRPGTAASSMEESVEEKVKSARSRDVISSSIELKRNYYMAFHNRKSEFLSEKYIKGKTIGFNEYYVPIDVNSRLERNEFFTVVTQLHDGELRLSGSLIDQ